MRTNELWIDFLLITVIKVPVGSERITSSWFLGHSRGLGQSIAVSLNWSRSSMVTVFNDAREAFCRSNCHSVE